MTAVLLACASALTFGAMSVALRIGFRGGGDASLAALTTALVALGVTVAAAVAETPSRGLHLERCWPFLLAGLLAPGASQFLFVRAVQEAGASRTSVVVGAAPLVSIVIALVFLHEPLRAVLVVGAVLIVAGGVELARERDRPEHLRRRGLVLAFGAMTLFATRDNVVRWLAHDTAAPPPAVAAATTLVTASLVVGLGVHRRRSLRGARPFVPAGICFGLSYVALFEAYYRGRVTVVSPLVATESLWGVGLSVLLLRRSELVGRRLVAGAVLVVAGAALIGAFR